MSSITTLKPFEIDLSKLIWKGKKIRQLTKPELLDALVECASLLVVERENLARMSRLLDLQLSMTIKEEYVGNE